MEGSLHEALAKMQTSFSDLPWLITCAWPKLIRGTFCFRNWSHPMPKSGHLLVISAHMRFVQNSGELGLSSLIYKTLSCQPHLETFWPKTDKKKLEFLNYWECKHKFTKITVLNIERMLDTYHLLIFIVYYLGVEISQEASVHNHSLPTGHMVPITSKHWTKSVASGAFILYFMQRIQHSSKLVQYKEGSTFRNHKLLKENKVQWQNKGILWMDYMEVCDMICPPLHWHCQSSKALWRYFGSLIIIAIHWWISII